MSIPAARLTPSLSQLLGSIQDVAGDACLVGGAVRDLLDNRQPHDLDIVTAQDAHAVAEALAVRLNGSPFVLDDERNTWRVVLKDRADVSEIDVSTISSGLDSDLLRRDFTVNAIAARIQSDGSLGEIIDPTGGERDLESRRLRMVGEAGLEDDPLRMLRAVRLSIELGLSIEPETGRAIQRLASTLNQSAAERQREELVRILATPRAAEAVRLMDSLGLLDVMLPELAPARDCDQPPAHHYWDVFNHLIETVASLDQMISTSEPNRTTGPQPAKSASWFASLFAKSERIERPWFVPAFRQGLEGFDLDKYLDGQVGGTTRRVLIKLAGLLHDISKPETKTVEPDGKVRFLGHPELGAVKAANICSRLRFGSRETAYVAKLVEEHLRPFQLSNKTLPSSRAIYRFFRDAGDATPGVLVLALADASAAVGPRLQHERWRNQVGYIAYVLENGLAQREVVTTAPRFLTGADLIAELHLEPGPQFGPILAAVEEAHATGQIASREEALALARKLISLFAEEVRQL